MTDAVLAPAQRASPSERRTLWVISAGHGIADAHTAFIPALMAFFALRFGLDLRMAAAVVTVFALTSSLPGPIFGRIADRLGHARMAAASIALTASTLSLLPLAPNAAALVTLAAVAGFGSAALHPAGSVLAREAAGSPEFGVAMFCAGGMLGYALGPVIVLATLQIAGDAGVAALALPGLVAAFALLAVLRGGANAQARRRSATGLRDLLPSRALLAVTVSGAFAFLPFATAVNGLPLWLAGALGLAVDDAWLGLTVTIFSLAGAAGGVALGLLSRRIGRAVTLAIALLGGAGAMQVLLLTAPASGPYVVLLVVGGALVHAATPLLVAAAQDLAPGAAAAAAGLVFGLPAAGAALLRAGVGWLMEVLGMEIALRLALAAPVLALVSAVPALRGISDGSGAHETAPKTLWRCATTGALGSVAEARCGRTGEECWCA